MPFTSLPICLDLTNVVSVSAGLRHTAVATRDGRAYTWGHGHRGQLGHIDSEGQLVKQQPTPKVVDHVEGKVRRGASLHRLLGAFILYLLKGENPLLWTLLFLLFFFLSLFMEGKVRRGASLHDFPGAYILSLLRGKVLRY